MSLLAYCREAQRRFLEKCTRCGSCARACPILPHTELREAAAREIQAGVFDFVAGGPPNRYAYVKAFACMECFKCTARVCPEGLNPLLVNEWIKGAYISRGLEKTAYRDGGKPDSAQRVAAGTAVSGADHDRITTAGEKRRARTVFFPGCNVYFQPDILLDALDILDAVGGDTAFLPGLDHCCGDNALFFGDFETADLKSRRLMEAITAFDPERVVLWCPTCLCRFYTYTAPAAGMPFDVLSFPQYLAGRMHRLPLGRGAAGTVTLHEACKSAYTGIDLTGPREVLRQIPGVTLREMPRSGKRTACCGSGAVCWFPRSDRRVRRARLDEAAATGAERLVTVCHHCNQVFASESHAYDFSVASYVRLVAGAMGIQREALCSVRSP